MPSPRAGKRKDVDQLISVIVTPVLDARSPSIAPVPVVRNVTPTGFSFRARNTSSRSSNTDGLSFNWLAVLNVPTLTTIPEFKFLDIRAAVAQPKRTDRFLDTTYWSRLWFSEPMGGQPAPFVFLTESDLHVDTQHNPALVGFVGQLGNLPGLPQDGFSIGAINVDTVGGSAAFQSMAFADFGEFKEDLPILWIDHGTEHNADDYFLANAIPNPRVPPYPISAGGRPGDWISLDIYFDRPFETPPTVLATARQPLRGVEGTPTVSAVRNVTTHGFTLASRNTDSRDGFVGFSWAAFGCAQGCI